ncbi:MAG TPA: ABC transporter ATP-binding protein [Acidiferrobacterales bacterium]|nr:ABC transporter ATP-binding protein [Acidiferrobacterales bacterium]
MSAAVVIDAVHKHYRAVHALKGVELCIQPGEFFGLLGPNGAGKSTLINIMAGLTRADVGSVSVLGHDVVKDYRRSRRCLGVVPQEIVFDPFFTVREVLRIQAGYFGLGKANEPWREELLAALMLTDKADANMRSLSGGMKRRVLIAQALVHKPEVVVLDEPTAGVDVGLRQSLWVFIRRLHKEGHTIMLTTHYLEEAESLCDRIAILDHGAVVALDTKKALLARGINTTLWVTTSEPIALFPPALQAKVKSRNGNQLELQLHKDTDSIVEVLDALRQAGAVITDLYTQDTDLEDIFMEITRAYKCP